VPSDPITFVAVSIHSGGRDVECFSRLPADGEAREFAGDWWDETSFQRPLLSTRFILENFTSLIEVRNKMERSAVENGIALERSSALVLVLDTPKGTGEPQKTREAELTISQVEEYLRKRRSKPARSLILVQC
jgi:hypothetical protein